MVSPVPKSEGPGAPSLKFIGIPPIPQKERNGWGTGDYTKTRSFYANGAGQFLNGMRIFRERMEAFFEAEGT